MGIVFNYLALTPALLQKAQRDRALAESLVCYEYDTPEPPGVLRRIDIDKAWDGAAYLLSEERRATDDLYLPSDPLAQAVFGTDEVLGDGWFDEGWGPFILRPPKGRSIARALAQLTRGDLRPHHDEEAMRAADVYCAGAELDYFLRAFDSLKGFYAHAANAGAAVVIYRS